MKSLRNIILSSVGITLIAGGSALAYSGTKADHSHGTAVPKGTPSTHDAGSSFDALKPPAGMRIKALLSSAGKNTFEVRGEAADELDMWQLRCADTKGSVRIQARINAADGGVVTDTSEIACADMTGVPGAPQMFVLEPGSARKQTWTIKADAGVTWKLAVYTPKQGKHPINASLGTTLVTNMQNAGSAGQLSFHAPFRRHVYLQTACTGSGYVTIIESPGAGYDKPHNATPQVRRCDENYGTFQDTLIDPCGGCNTNPEGPYGESWTDAYNNDRFAAGGRIAVIASPTAGFVYTRVAYGTPFTDNPFSM